MATAAAWPSLPACSASVNPLHSRRVYLAVATSAIAVYLGALLNGFALDDVPIIQTNPLTHHWSALWRAFAEPYWPPSAGAALYRPLAIASYAVDWQAGRVAWLHAVNLLWHAGVSVAVAALVRRWTGSIAGAVAAGVLFAVHPVHVEAVANLVGRAELMAALFVILAVLAALEYNQLWWSLVAFTAGLLSKETAVTTPLLIGAGWLAGVGTRLTKRRMLAYGASWVGVGAAYCIVRWLVLRDAEPQVLEAPVFVGASFTAVRLTAVAAFADFARLLLFPVTLRVDYSPAERTLVTTPLDLRFGVGALCFLAWGALLVWVWRRGRRTEAFGLCWVAIALLPVANLIVPIGVLVAERTLYLPSVGLAIAVGAWLRHAPARPLVLVTGAVLLAGGARTVLRVPVWSSTQSVIRSVSRDSPRSYVGPMWMAVRYLDDHQPERALETIRVAARITDHAPKVLLLGADAALQLGQTPLADSLLARHEAICHRCPFYYENEARAALARGDTAVAATLLDRAERVRRQRRR